MLKWITNRQHKNVSLLLKGFCGRLQSDGYAAYQKHASACDNIILLACWAHTIRKFKEALVVEPTEAAVMCRLIKKLYELEADWNEQGVDTAERAQLRQSTSMPIVQEIKTKLDAYSIDVSIPNNNFKTAVNYALGQWPALVECFQHGNTMLDTNLLEGQFRAQNLGEKNWKWIGLLNAGEKSAIVFLVCDTDMVFLISEIDADYRFVLFSFHRRTRLQTTRAASIPSHGSDDSNQMGARQGAHNPRTTKALCTLNLADSASRMGVSAHQIRSNYFIRAHLKMPKFR